MTKYMKEHTEYLKKFIDEDTFTEEILDYHRVQIEHLKHERLVHLIVMCLFAVMVLICIGIFISEPVLLVGVLFIILTVTECFYIAITLNWRIQYNYGINMRI